MSFEHMEPYTDLSPRALAALRDDHAGQDARDARALALDAAAIEDRAEADRLRERRDDHMEQACPRARRRIRQERAAVASLYPARDVTATPRTYGAPAGTQGAAHTEPTGATP